MIKIVAVDFVTLNTCDKNLKVTTKRIQAKNIATKVVGGKIK